MVDTAKRPHPGDLHTLAFELINARGASYDNASDLEQNFREIAAVASIVTGKDLTARDTAIVLHCVKLLRSKSDPFNIDHYVDGMNYWAFAGCFTGLPPIKAPEKTDKKAVFHEDPKPTLKEVVMNP